MKRMAFVAAILVLAAVGLFTATGASRLLARELSDEAQIEQTSSAFAQAWDRADARSMADLFHDDADILNPRGLYARGRDEIEQLLLGEHLGEFRGTSYELIQFSVRLIGSDAALADWVVVIRHMVDEHGRPMPAMVHRVPVIFARRNGEWRIVAARPGLLVPHVEQPMDDTPNE